MKIAVEKLKALKSEHVEYIVYTLYGSKVHKHGIFEITPQLVGQFCKDWITNPDEFSTRYGLCMNFKNWLLKSIGVSTNPTPPVRSFDGEACTISVQEIDMVTKCIDAFFEFECGEKLTPFALVYPFGGSTAYANEKCDGTIHLNKHRVAFAKFMSEHFA